MKSNRFRFTLFSIIVYLACLNAAGVSALTSEGKDVHFCLFDEWHQDNRRFARNPAYGAKNANLNVGEPRTVRTIYFLPNDRPYRADIVQRIKEMVRGVQTFFAEQMMAHGHGEITYRIETDSHGEPLVHRVDGKHPNNHYYDDTDDTMDVVGDEIRLAFDLSANVYLTVIDNARRGIKFDGSTAAGVAGGNIALIPANYVIDDYDWELPAHELGHTFGLQHDFRRDANVMSYGSLGLNRSQLSQCHADFLSVHPYFNPKIPIEKGVPPTIELISPSKYAAGSEHVSVKVALNDSAGLHQAILFDSGPAFFGETPEGGGKYYGRVWGCKRLAGEKDATVEFNYDGGRGVILTDLNQLSITVGAVDTDGNVRYESFVLEVDDATEQGRVPTLVKIAGFNQQAPINTQLAQPFVVELRDRYGNVLPGEQISFIVTAGDGRFSGQFSIQTTTTDANGRAEGTLTLGPNPENNTVLVRTPRLTACLPVHFNAVGIGMPTVTMSGDYGTWSLADGAIRRFGKGILHKSDRAVDISPNGQRLAVASSIGVWIYDVTTSRELALLPTASSVNTVSFSPVGTTLASGLADGRINLWDVATGTNIATLSELWFRPSGISSVAFSRDGKTLASGSFDHDIDLWDVETGYHLATLEENPAQRRFLRPIPVSFSPDGSILASGSYDGDSTVKLWDVAKRTWIATLTDHMRWVNSVAFSPDGSILASGADDGAVILWNVATKESIASLKHRAAVGSVEFSPDGSTIAVGLPFGHIKLWDLATETNIATFEGQVSWTVDVSSVSFSTDGKILAAMAGDTVSLWDVEQGNANLLYGHNNVGNSMSFSLDGTTLASGSWDGTVKLWDVETGRNIYSFSGLHVPHHGSYAPSVVAFSPDEKTLVAGFYGKIMLWDVDTRTHLTTFDNALDGPLVSLSFSPDGATLFRGHSEKIVRMDVATGTRITTDPLEPTLGSMALSPDGKTLASGARLGTVSLWDASTLTHIVTLDEDVLGGEVKAVAFSPDGRILAAGRQSEIKLWDVTKRTLTATLGNHGSWLYSVAFSPDERILAAGLEDGRVVLWDVQTRQIIATLEGHKGWVVSVVFSHDGTTLATGSSQHLGDGTILQWDMTPHITPSPELTDEISPDRNLRAAIVAALGKTSSDTIIPAEMLMLTDLDARGKNIANLTGLEFATNLKSLYLTSNSISDISAVSGLTNLESLWLQANSISDISAVSGLTNLTRLRLANNSISDISAVSGLTKLKALTLDANSVSDISAVSGLTNLTFLTLSDNSISNISALTGLTNLKDLRIDWNSISDISALARLTNLKYLELQANSISDISALAGLTNLESLRIQDNSISDISALAGLRNLNYLQIRDNLISDLSPLVENPGLAKGDEVNVRENRLSYTSIYTHIPILQSRGVTVKFDSQAHPALLKISGDDQTGLPGEALEKPFVVEAKDENGSALEGVTITFTVTSGDGILSTTSTVTDANGFAESTLTLGPNPGTTTVKVSVVSVLEIQMQQTFTAIAEPPRIPQDVNGDNLVDILDLVLVASAIGDESPNLAADVNADGVVDLLDLVSVARAFGDVAAAPSSQAPETLTTADVREWLNAARSLVGKDAVIMRGIVALEQLLAALTPDETALLPNFPNPFNPETWIPYQLVEDAEVTLTIYNTKGVTLRRLDLGYRLAGYYSDREKAAYWDGRNDNGESVASGLYFYQLATPSFRQLRRMVILK